MNARSTMMLDGNGEDGMMEIEVLSKTFVLEALVSSETNEGAYYKVTFDHGWSCTCPSFKHRSQNVLGCKHTTFLKQELQEEMR